MSDLSKNVPNALPDAFSDEEKTDPEISLPALGFSIQAPDPSPEHTAQFARDISDFPPAEISALIQPAPAVREAPSLTLPPLAPAVAPAETAPASKVKMPDMGILNPYMKDPAVSEIMVNDTRNIMIEKGGQIFVANGRFNAIDELNRIARNVLEAAGRVLSDDQPYLDAMLPDGSRVNLVGPPLTQNGLCMTIRKFPSTRFTLDDLAKKGMLDQRMSIFLKACVLGRLNLIISGGTSSGKTTLLNALLALVPKNERLVTIEDTPELVVQQVNSVALHTKPDTPEAPPVGARELVANSLRMRPDRIILGECRRSEALDMLQAMNTGHDGSMTTVHANSPRDALSRLETLCLMGGLDLPLTAIRRQISEAVDLLIHVKRFRDGQRRIAAITELSGMEGEVITTQEIFRTTPDGSAFNGTGLVPSFIERLHENGVELPKDLF